jgi:hypothetical protein
MSVMVASPISPRDANLRTRKAAAYVGAARSPYVMVNLWTDSVDSQASGTALFALSNYLRAH